MRSRGKILYRAIAAALLFAWWALAALAETLVSGTISTNTTWTLAGSPYIVTGDVFVQGSGTPVLTVEPGVVVKFNAATQLAVNYGFPGRLQAVGTSASPILFTANGSTTPGFWYGLYLGGYSPTAASQVSYATVEYGGVAVYSRGGIHTVSASPTIDNVTVRNSVVAGVSIDGGSPVITACTLTSNSGPGVSVGAGSPTITGSTISSNSGSGIDVLVGSASISADTITSNTGFAISVSSNASLLGLTGLTVSGQPPGRDAIERRGGTISADQTWPVATIPYVVSGDVFVQGSGTPVLTVEPGVVVKFNAATQLAVNYGFPGRLQAVGTSASPILFTANGSTTGMSRLLLNFRKG